MSWVEKLDSGRVRAVYRDDEGRRRSRTFDRRAEAKAWLAAEATDRARGQWIDPRGGALPFADWAEQWFAGRLVRPTTAASDRGRYATHLEPEFGPVPLREISPLRVRAFIAVLATRRAPATVRHVQTALPAGRYCHLSPAAHAEKDPDQQACADAQGDDSLDWQEEAGTSARNGAAARLAGKWQHADGMGDAHLWSRDDVDKRQSTSDQDTCRQRDERQAAGGHGGTTLDV